jgi:hypothetical protein
MASNRCRKPCLRLFLLSGQDAAQTPLRPRSDPAQTPLRLRVDVFQQTSSLATPATRRRSQVFDTLLCVRSCQS